MISKIVNYAKAHIQGALKNMWKILNFYIISSVKNELSSHLKLTYFGSSLKFFLRQIGKKGNLGYLHVFRYLRIKLSPPLTISCKKGGGRLKG